MKSIRIVQTYRYCIMGNMALKELAVNVNYQLNEYLSIDDELSKKSKVILSTFSPIPFSSYEDRLAGIAEALGVTLGKIKSIPIDNYSHIKNEFRETLLSYTTALISSVKLLCKSVGDLNQVSKGSQGRKVTFAEHLSNDNYNNSMHNYLQYGQKLNNLFDQLHWAIG